MKVCHDGLMPTTDASIYFHLFQSVPGMTYKNFQRIYKYFPNLQYAWEKGTSSEFRKILRCQESLSGMRRMADAQKSGLCVPKIDPETLTDAIRESRCARSIASEIAKLLKYQIRLLTIDDEDYPELLKQIHDPPFLLYYRGTLKTSDICLAVVGSRLMSSYGESVVNRFMETLAFHKLTIISGLALGADSEAHLSALRCGMRTIAVLGTGLDYIYPPQNKNLARKIEENGAIISEFPPGTPGRAMNFPMRNRIISGLSLGTLIVEAKERSGSLITANLAIQQNREVFAIPGAIDHDLSRGTNRLIQKGEAYPVLNGQDIIDALQGQRLFDSYTKKFQRRKDEIHPEERSDHPPLRAKNFDTVHTRDGEISDRKGANNVKISSLGSDEKAVAELIKTHPIHFESLNKKTGIPPSKLNHILSMLELKNIIRSTGGGKYVKS